ncbi:DNA replication ATP-dependent helicase/nuclease DNA2 [Forsythia ovata]|uniref:DNA replication ATP-dependent helicase/nuclease DNA2 n=1 Tax=Forsythia ovata TaxID=205694 RepID=A0ABD1VH51_9LAMI
MDSTHMLPLPTPLPPQKIDRDLWILFTLLVLGFVCTIVYLKLSARTTAVVPPSHPAAANNGLKKKVLKYLPKLTYATNNDNLFDCAICLTEFAIGDELRVLPQWWWAGDYMEDLDEVQINPDFPEHKIQMAPRKRTSGGAKKSNNQNQNQQSQLPKYGIQHFFEQHSQSQKALSQNSSKNNINVRNPISDSAVGKKKNLQISPKAKSVDPNLSKGLEDASVEAQEPRNLASSRKIDSMGKYLRGENPNNLAGSSKIEVNNGVYGDNESRKEMGPPDRRNWDSGIGEKSRNDLNLGVVPLENSKNVGNVRETELNNQPQNSAE